ncbi:winged helix-turn-helix transcriptional regulator [Microbacterium sp. NPDC055903]
MMVSFAQLKEQRPLVFDQGCSTRVVLDHVMSKWGVLVLSALSDGTRRWGELRREVGGISEKMLASTLRTLADDGLVHRESFPTVPPHVEYSLTPLGRDLMDRMLPLMEWVADHADGMLGRDA